MAYQSALVSGEDGQQACDLPLQGIGDVLAHSRAIVFLLLVAVVVLWLHAQGKPIQDLQNACASQPLLLRWLVGHQGAHHLQHEQPVLMNNGTALTMVQPQDSQPAPLPDRSCQLPFGCI